MDEKGIKLAPNVNLHDFEQAQEVVEQAMVPHGVASGEAFGLLHDMQRQNRPKRRAEMCQQTLVEYMVWSNTVAL